MGTPEDRFCRVAAYILVLITLASSKDSDEPASVHENTNNMYNVSSKDTYKYGHLPRLKSGHLPRLI